MSKVTLQAMAHTSYFSFLFNNSEDTFTALAGTSKGEGLYVSCTICVYRYYLLYIRTELPEQRELSDSYI